MDTANIPAVRLARAVRTDVNIPEATLVKAFEAPEAITVETSTGKVQTITVAHIAKVANRPVAEVAAAVADFEETAIPAVRLAQAVSADVNIPDPSFGSSSPEIVVVSIKSLYR